MSSINSIIPISCRLGEFCVIGKDVMIGERVTIWHHVNLYGCDLADRVMIGSFSEVQNDVSIDEDSRISSHSFICSGTKIGKRVFVGHHVCTINDTFSNGQVNYDKKHWGKLIIEDDCIIGSAAVLFPVRIGHHAVIGAGAVVTKDVAPFTIIVGNPAKELQK